MASAGLKRPSDFELSVSPHSTSGSNPCWSVNKRRCTSFVMQPTMVPPSSSILSNTPSQYPIQLSGGHNNVQPNLSNPLQASTASTSSLQSFFRDPSLILSSLSEDVTCLIKHEMHRAHHSQHQQHQQNPPNQQQNDYNNQLQSNQLEPPVLTVRQTQMICEKLIREREQKLREEYDKILINKLAEQHATFVKYTEDHIEKRYNQTNSHQSSYLS